MLIFRGYPRDYFDKHRKPDGSKLSNWPNQCNGIILRRLNEMLGDTPFDRTTRQIVDEWYADARDVLTVWMFEQTARIFKRIMFIAANEQTDGTPPVF